MTTRFTPSDRGHRLAKSRAIGTCRMFGPRPIPGAHTMTTRVPPADLARASIETWAKSDIEAVAPYVADVSYGAPLATS